MKKLLTEEKKNYYIISMGAIVVACFFAFIINKTNVSFYLPEPIAQSKIWLWITYPYHFLVNILPKDSFIFENFSAELVSFWVVAFIYLLILYGLLPASQRESDKPKWIISYLITYPLAISFMFLFGIVFIGVPISIVVTLIT